VLGVDHLDLVVTDLERSLAFYNGLLEPLGFTRNSVIAGERGERSSTSAASACRR
jgi:catechol 2,3-dioxygenase-like lactoylglutathione lyase family enzyme